MDNFTYKKEQLIWIKEDFITDELCFDIIEMIESLNQKNIPLEEVFFSNFTDWHKIKKFLIDILNQELIHYKTMVNSKLLFTLEKTNKTNFVTLTVPLFDINTFNFSIETQNKQIIERTERFEVTNKIVKIKIIKYIIFVKDYEGEIVFWNEYKIKPRKGNLLLFPVSWCFPYYENIKIDSDKTFMCGFFHIYNNFNI
jgi:hypothetical protein